MFLKTNTYLLVCLLCSLSLWCKSTSAGSSFLSPSQKPQVSCSYSSHTADTVHVLWCVTDVCVNLLSDALTNKLQRQERNRNHLICWWALTGAFTFSLSCHGNVSCNKVCFFVFTFPPNSFIDCVCCSLQMCQVMLHIQVFSPPTRLLHWHIWRRLQQTPVNTQV